MMRTKAPILFLLFLMIVSDLHAGEPATNRGIDLSGAFHVADFDVVNLYNGNLLVDLPLAAQFPLNGGFSYGIHLVYTGQPWDFPMEERPGPLPEDPNQVKAVPVPNRRSNAGIGWRVSMGRLILSSDATNLCDDYQPEDCRATLYESPDGADHRFTGTTNYTDDGSYLRLTTNTAANPNYEELEFPDGSVHRFDTQGRLIGIYTPFDRTASSTPTPSVTVEYLTNDTANQCHDTGASSCWKVHDNLGRTEFVTFYTTSNLYKSQLARRIIVTAPAGNSVTYTLNYYQQTAGNHVDSSDFDLHLDTCYDRWRQVTDANTARVPILTSVDLPDGSRYDIGTEHNDVGSLGGCFEGSLLKLTLPTRGTIEYGYFDWLQGHERNYDPPYLPGVYTRTKTTADGSKSEVWTYVPEKGAGDTTGWPSVDRPNPQYRDRMVTITDPDQRVSRHYFNNAPYPISQASINAGWTPAEAGLPYTRRDGTRTPDPTKTNPTAADDFFLSTEVLNASGAVERSTYVQYDYDAVSTQTTPATFRRERATLTKYSDGKWSLTARSNFDHFGHFRKMETYGNFAAESPGQDRRTEFVNYNPARGTWGVTGWTDWDPHAPWVLNTFDQQWVNVPKTNPNDTAEASSHTKKAEFCFDPNTGFLQRRRLLRGDATTADAIAQDGADLVTEFGRSNHDGSLDVTGNVLSEKSYGGDTPYGAAAVSIPSGSLCGLSLPTPRYQLWHTYQNGVRATSEYYSNGLPMGFKKLDRTIDLTGAVASERDTSGVATTYTFDTDDPLRIKTITRPGTATITYAYANAAAGSSFTPAQITVTQADMTSRIQYDSFGRVWREFRTMPTIGEVTRETLYDSSNRKLSQSMWDLSSYARKTTYHYDFLGRPDSIDPPDHQTVTMAYVGDSKRTTTMAVVKTTDPSPTQTPVTTVERLDRFGRLSYLKEPDTVDTNGSSVTGTVTAYGYDVTGELARVCMNASLTGEALSTATCPQQRKFIHDNRGFLTSETHPENGTVAYTYDALGHVLTKRLATTNATNFDLNYLYDDAERLLQVDSWYPAGHFFRASKVFTFGPDNVGSNLKRGKLETATRHNFYPSVGDIRVVETYAYNDAAGRLTDRTTEVGNVSSGSSTPSRSVTQSQHYSAQGMVDSITYPYCLFQCGTPNTGSVGLTYANGWLTGVFAPGVGNYATSLGYHPNGMINTVVHGNGVTDTQTNDPNGIPRPQSITFGSFGSCVAPTMTVPLDSATIPSGGQKTWFANASGSGTLAYQWYKDGVAQQFGATSQGFTTGALTSSHDYYVRVANSCGAVQSNTANVTIATAPSISVQPQSTAFTPPSVTLTVTANGNPSPTYQWYEGTSGGGTPITGATLSSYSTPNLSATTSYWVRVSNVGGVVNSTTATVTVTAQLSAPTSLIATMQTTTSVQVSWVGSSGAQHYEVWRREFAGAVHKIAESTSISYSDNSAAANTTYVYQVCASPTAGNACTSSFSNQDLATTVAFTNILANPAITLATFTELLTAVNAVRAAGGSAAVTWTQILQGSPAPPAPAQNGIVYGEHILALRREMENARQTLLGIPPQAYTDPILPGSPRITIKAIHINELRGRAQ